jgi:hypothetical protein
MCACAMMAYDRFMEEDLLNLDEKENPDELLEELEKVLHADGNHQANERIGLMSKDELNEILQTARRHQQQRQKRLNKKKKGLRVINIQSSESAGMMDTDTDYEKEKISAS